MGQDYMRALFVITGELIRKGLRERSFSGQRRKRIKKRFIASLSEDERDNFEDILAIEHVSNEVDDPVE